MSKKVLQTEFDMQTLAQTLGASLHGGDVLLLFGDLGSGKTTFVQALGTVLGVTEAITSPTFTVFGVHAVVGHPTIQSLVHVDLYRLPPAKQSDGIVQDILEEQQKPGTLLAIEWAEKITDNPFPNAYRLTFEHGASDWQRVVTIEQ